jgi:nitrite reductase/ring-hydroxylating ferredoxin subunit
MNDDRTHAVDARVNTPRREGLTGTTPANLYLRPPDAEQLTSPPDGRPWDVQPSWRRDFPIDHPQDRYVERRDFMKFMVLTSAAFTAGQFWIAGENFLRRRRGRPELARIANLRDVPIGGALAFSYPGENDPCLLLRPSGETLVAYSQKCTHLSCAVVPRAEEGVMFCPCHEGVFDVPSGRPLAGPPRRPLPRILLEVRGDDIFATGIELRTV